jgi:hypothetical protein
MNCDHENGLCLLPFVDDMTLEEFIRRLVHVGLLRLPATSTEDPA